MMFGAKLLSLVHEAAEAGFVDPLSLLIVERVDRFNRSAVCLLALTCLRYSDLYNLDISAYLSGQDVSLKQNKTGSIIKLPALPKGLLSQSRRIHVPVHPLNQSYSSVRHSLGKAVPLFLARSLEENAHKTHIFRHLRASYLISKSHTHREISVILGHHGNTAVNSYVHNNLVQYFINNPK